MLDFGITIWIKNKKKFSVRISAGYNIRYICVSNKFYLNKNKIHSAHVNISNGINGI